MASTICSAAAAALVSLVAAAPSQAGTVELRFAGTATTAPEPKGGGSFTYSIYDLAFGSAPGETSELRVVPGQSSNAIRLRDSGAPIVPGEGCRRDDAYVVCELSLSSSQIGKRTFDLGDGGDSVTLDSTFGDVDAGPGPDTVRFVNGSGTVKLGAGDDTAIAEQAVSPGIVAVTVDGGPGADTLTTAANGRLRASYADRTAGVSATLDGIANDGEPGENDQLGSGVRAIIGGSGPDSLTGGPDEDGLIGGAGNDVLRGLAGKDTFDGGAGDDVLDGGEGDEVFVAEAGAETVRGGAGFDWMYYDRTETDRRPVAASLDDQPGDGVPGENDDIGSDVEALEGGWGDDRLTGSDGPDRLTAVRGVDLLDGRGGADTLISNDATVGMLTGGPGPDAFRQVGIADTVNSTDGERDTVDCRERGIPPINGDAADLGTGCLGGLDVPNARRRANVDGHGVTSLAVTCGDLGPVCAGSLRLRASGTVVAGGRARARRGTVRVARLRLSERGLRLLRRRGSLTVTATMTTTRSLPAETRTRSERVKLVLAPR
jgi:hypothetical protein